MENSSLNFDTGSFPRFSFDLRCGWCGLELRTCCQHLTPGLTNSNQVPQTSKFWYSGTDLLILPYIFFSPSKYKPFKLLSLEEKQAVCFWMAFGGSTTSSAQGNPIDMELIVPLFCSMQTSAPFVLALRADPVKSGTHVWRGLRNTPPNKFLLQAYHPTRK